MGLSFGQAISLRSIPVSTSNTAADRSGNHVEDPPNAQTARRPPARAGRVEVQILAEGVNGHDNAGDACGQAQACAQKLDQALVGDAAEVFEQIAVAAESTGGASWGCRTRNAGAAPDRGCSRPAAPRRAGPSSGGRTGRTSGPYRRRPTGGPPCSDRTGCGRSCGPGPRTRGTFSHLWNDGRQEAIAGLEALLVGLEELVEMV